jgi:hypothetical protein
LLSPVLAIALLAPAAARGEGCPAATPALAAAPDEARIAFLREHLQAERGPALAWTWTFGVVNGGLTAVQLAQLSGAKTTGDRAVLAAGAATSAAAVAQVLLAPITPDPRAIPAGGEPCEELRQLERALARSARNERLGTGTAAQVGNLLINVGLGIATGFVAGKAGPGIVTFAVGWSLGELQILTEPTGLVRAEARYQAGDLGPGSPVRGAPTTALGPGLAIRLAF